MQRRVPYLRRSPRNPRLGRAHPGRRDGLRSVPRPVADRRAQRPHRRLGRRNHVRDLPQQHRPARDSRDRGQQQRLLGVPSRRRTTPPSTSPATPAVACQASGCHPGTNAHRRCTRRSTCADCHSSADPIVIAAIAAGDKRCATCHPSADHAAIHVTATPAVACQALRLPPRHRRSSTSTRPRRARRATPRPTRS